MKGQRALSRFFLLGAVLLSVGCGAFEHSVDVYYKAGWVVSHWGDSARFPAGAELCIEPFCTRTDTAKHYAGGHKGYTSEVDYSYCPEHAVPSPEDGSQLGEFGHFLYWSLAVILSLMVLILPVHLLLEGAFRLFGRSFTEHETAMMAVYYVLMGVCAIAWIMFLWW